MKIPVFFKAIRPAAPVADPADENDEARDSDIVPDDEDAGLPDADGADGEPASDAPPVAVDPDDADAGNDDPDATPAPVAATPDAKAGAASEPVAATPDATPAASDVVDKNPPMSYFTELLALIAERAPGAANGDGFGPDTVKPGHHVAFSAGDFSGSGKVHAAGADGVTVHDSANRKHTVHWNEVTGHYAGDEDGEDAPAAAGKKDAK